MNFSDNYWDLVQETAAKENSEFFYYSCEGRESDFGNMIAEDLLGWLIPFDQTDDFRMALEQSDANDVDESWSKFFVKASWDYNGGCASVSFVKTNNAKTFRYPVHDENDKEVFEHQYEVLFEHIPGIATGDFFSENEDADIQEFIYEGKHLWLYNNYKQKTIYMESEFDLSPFFPLPYDDSDEEDDEETDE